MTLVGILPMKDRMIKNLSKGYKQRVGLAQAMIGYPDIIILDEPTVGLDPKQIIEIRDLIKKLSENHTIIFSSHILSEVSAVCDYIMIINNGKLIASDTTENLSKMKLGANTLEMTIKGSKTAIQELLDTVEEIQSIDWKNAKEEGTEEFVLTMDESADIREKIFYLMADHQLPILNMYAKKNSLEDIFLELTENKPQEGVHHDSNI